MILINLWGGPGSGKSTTAASLFVDLKNNGISAELVGEYAKEMYYQGRTHLLGPGGNQIELFAGQYGRIKNLERAGCQVAISDSPLLMQLIYCQDYPYFASLKAMAEKSLGEFTNIDVFIRRTKHFDPFGRVQKTVEEARVFDVAAVCLKSDYGHFDFTAEGDAEGQKLLGKHLLTNLKERI